MGDILKLKYFPILIIAVPVYGAFIAAFLGLKSEKIRDWFVVLVSFVTFLLVAGMTKIIFANQILRFSTSQAAFGVGLNFSVDKLSYFMAIITSFIWLVVTIYSLGYMSHESKRNRFYFFWLLVLGANLGVYLTSDFFSLFIFFEGLSIFAYPLIIHSETDEAKKAGTKYLYMAIIGGLALLSGIFLMLYYGGSTNISFTMANSAAAVNVKILIAVLMMVGFGVKAGMVPLHVWLPDAHSAAPSPASALLSGVMIKAGAYGIIRLVHFNFGPSLFVDLGLSNLLLGLALIAIIAASAAAIKQTEIKRMLAYSSVAQMGYILAGIALASPVALIGGIIHILNHALMKSTLFLSAGAFYRQTGKKNISELKGIGWQTPMIAFCFSIAGLSMIGLPLFAGFVSKWFLAVGALDSSSRQLLNPSYSSSVIVFLLLSSLLNLAYYGPIILNAWRKNVSTDTGKWSNNRKLINNGPGRAMLLPVIILTVGVILAGIYPKVQLGIAESIAGPVVKSPKPSFDNKKSKKIIISGANAKASKSIVKEINESKDKKPWWKFTGWETAFSFIGALCFVLVIKILPKFLVGKVDGEYGR